MEPYIEQIRPYLEHYGYGIVFGSILLENFGLPLPGETFLITGAILAAQSDRFGIVPLVLTGWAAAVIGDNLAYGLGRFAGRGLVIRYGKYVFITDRRLKRVETVFRRYGGIIVIFARFWEILRQLNGIAAGTVKMSWRRFLLYNFLGAGLWVGFWSITVYLFSSRAGFIFHFFKRFEMFILAAFGILAAAALLLLALRRFRSR